MDPVEPAKLYFFDPVDLAKLYFGVPKTLVKGVPKTPVNAVPKTLVTGRIDFKMLISIFWPPGEGFQVFRPQIRLQHAKISMLTSFEVNWLQSKRFPNFCPVAFQWPE